MLRAESENGVFDLERAKRVMQRIVLATVAAPRAPGVFRASAPDAGGGVVYTVYMFACTRAVRAPTCSGRYGCKHAARSAPPGLTMHGQPWVPASAATTQSQVGLGWHCDGIGLHA
jgi:hypothetical protein